MDNPAAEFKLARYREIAALNKKGTVSMVHDMESQIYCVKKTLSNYDLQVYQNLKNHAHPKLARIFDFFLYDSKLVLIEEFINGSTLLEVLEKEGVLKFDRACEIILELCQALEYLHKRNPPLIHRDIKPSNIMIRADGSVVLIDFNISRIFKAGYNEDTMIMGTAGFAAPEQFGFHQTDARTDIYALGILLNYLLTGHHPKDQLCNGPMDQVVCKCTLIDPGLRYQNIGQLKSEVTRCHRHLPRILKRSPERILNLLWKVCLAAYAIPTTINAVFFTQSYLYGIWGVLDRMILGLFDFSIIALILNFGHIHSYLPITSSKTLEVRILGCVLYFFVLFLIYFVLQQFVQALERV